MSTSFHKNYKTTKWKHNSVINEGWHDHYPSTPTLSFAATILKKREHIFVWRTFGIFFFIVAWCRILLLNSSLPYFKNQKPKRARD